jgi:hypothetical protein
MANNKDWLTAPAEASGLTEVALAEHSGIPLSTLRRRRRRALDLTMGELLGLSEALTQTPTSFFPVVLDEVEPLYSRRRPSAGESTALPGSESDTAATS